MISLARAKLAAAKEEFPSPYQRGGVISDTADGAKLRKAKRFHPLISGAV